MRERAGRCSGSGRGCSSSGGSSIGGCYIVIVLAAVVAIML